MDKKIVRTRIAPSPTGDDLHIGNLYAAIFNFAFAKQNNGQFIVRVEDTDQKRKVEGSEEKIMQTLKDFGIIYDEGVDVDGKFGPYRQSERLPLYAEKADELIRKGKAYYCFCSAERLDELREQQKKDKKPPKYDKYCLHNVTLEQARVRVDAGESYVVRLDVPENKEITFKDLIRGEITINSDNFDDQVLMKSDGFPTYHLAVVVDDHLMEISHVIRGEEWISSTPKHILLYEAFGWEKPIYVHVPLLRNPDKSKLSKRKNPVWSSWYLENGFLPEAVLNYLALMGWSHPEGKEIFSMEEFIQVVDLTRFSTVGPIFDIKKLEWMNGEYIRQLTPSDLVELLKQFFNKKYTDELLAKTVPLVQERIKTLKEFDEYCEFFIRRPKEFEVDLGTAFEILAGATSQLSQLSETEWKAEKIGEVLQVDAQSKNIPFGKYFMPIRIALTGKKITPPLNESIEILGKEETIVRLNK